MNIVLKVFALFSLKISLEVRIKYNIFESFIDVAIPGEGRLTVLVTKGAVASTLFLSLA